MKFFKDKRILLILSVVFLIILSAGVWLTFNSQKLLERSSASIKTDGEKISISFQILPQDKPLQSQFSSNLGIGDSWSSGFSLSLDQQTVDLIKSSLAKKLFLDFSNKELKFSSERIPLLTTALVGKDYNFATGSAKLHLRAVNSSDYTLEIDGPKDLVKYASSSGQLYLSKELSGLFPLLDKVATIKVSSSGGNTQGEIILK